MSNNSPFPRVHVDTLKSTQNEARSRLSQGSVVPFWVTAQEQTEGKGRSGRSWQSSYGNYAGSLVLVMPQKREDAPKYSMVCALALSASFEELGIRNISIKWPNDVLIDLKKIAGILIEAEGDHLIIGIGVNLVFRPMVARLEARALPTASLSDFAEIDFNAFHHLLDKNMQLVLDQFNKYGFEPIRRAVKDKLLVRENMIFDDGREEFMVHPSDIGDKGQLIVHLNGVTKELYAGDLIIEEGQSGLGD